MIYRIHNELTITTDKHELLFDEFSHEACRVTDVVKKQQVFIGSNRQLVMYLISAMT